MIVKHELTFDEMPDFLWGVARENWVSASEEQRLAAWDMLEDIFNGEAPEDVAINDFIAFECSDIFSSEDDYDESLKRNKLESRIKRLEKFILCK
jgi:hypothetical protein